MTWRLAKTLIYLNFDPMGVSRAHILKMKHKKITYIHHYVPWTKIPDDMNKSFVWYRQNMHYFGDKTLSKEAVCF